MPDVPPDVAIKATIRPGSVYYIKHEAITHSEDFHYFIVINLDPINEDAIILVCSTTRKYKVAIRYPQTKFPPETLIKITPDEYSGFSYTSIIDCNQVYPDSINGLINRLAGGNLILKPEMDVALVERIRLGVLASPRTSEEVKELLRDKGLPA